MKPWVHVAVIVAGGASFYALISAWSESLGNVSPRWYHEPIVFPVRAALWFSDNPHDMNVTVGNIAYGLECVAAGFVADLLALTGIRCFGRRKTDDKKA